MKRSPRHLWSGEWRADSKSAREESAREAAEGERKAAAQERASETQKPDASRKPSSQRRRVSRNRAAIALAVASLAGGAFAAGTLLDDGGGSDALPATSRAVVKPSHGQTRAGAIYVATSPAVVSIKTDGGSGTGFLINSSGRIVTNSHVVGTSKRVIVRFGADSAAIDAEVLGTDPSSDLAVLGIDSQRVPGGVKPLQLADSGGVQVGDPAIAIGNPFGLDRTATEGIVSGVGREIQAPNGFSIDAVIQTDAPINPGNSGGPLLDGSGRVIGVNSQIQTGGSQGNVGIGFAVPSNTVRQVVPILERGGTIKRPYLGLASSTASPSNPSGAEVQNVVSGSPADRAGIRQRDIITGIGGKMVKGPSDISAAIAKDKPGDTVDIQVERDGSSVTLHATLGTRPGATP